MMNQKEIGTRLRQLHGKESCKKIAQDLGISKSALFMYERGERMPRDEVKEKISKRYGMSVQSIFYDEFEHI